MYNRKMFWTCVFFCAIGILIGVTLCGCYPNEPPVAARHYGNMRIGSVNTQSASDGTNSRPERDLAFGHWAELYCEENRLELGNAKATLAVTYYWESGAVTGTGNRTIRSNNRGYFLFDVASPGIPAGRFKVNYVANLTTARAGNSILGVFSCEPDAMHPNPGYMDPIDYPYRYDYTYAGRYWMSGSQVGAEHKSSVRVKPLPRRRPVRNNQAFLSQEPEPFSEPVCVASTQWNILSYDENDVQIGKPIQYFERIDDFRNDPNHAQSITENSTPYYQEIYFWTKEPLLLAGRCLTGKLLVGSTNEPNLIEPIEINILADSNDLRSHVACTGYVVVAEPNSYEPYRIGDILVLPAEEGQKIGIDFDDWTQLIDLICPYWLSACSFDINKDGILNFGDWQ